MQRLNNENDFLHRVKKPIILRYFLCSVNYRVATHSGKSGNFKIVENLRETQRKSENFKIVENLRETQGDSRKFKIKKIIKISWVFLSLPEIFYNFKIPRVCVATLIIQLQQKLFGLKSNIIKRHAIYKQQKLLAWLYKNINCWKRQLYYTKRNKIYSLEWSSIEK